MTTAPRLNASPTDSVASAVIHARLRRLKGETDADDLRAVFA